MALGDVKQLATREYSLNRLHSGSFERLPYRYEPYLFDLPTTTLTEKYKVVNWQKIKIRQGDEVPLEGDYSLIPGWRVKCSIDQGAVVSYNPIDPVTGFRLYSKDGGNAIVVAFLVDCEVYMEQDIDPYAEFPMQPVTVAMSGYCVAGNVKVLQSFDFGAGEENVRVTYSGSFGAYRRLASTYKCPGKMTQMLYRVTLEGTAGESTGMSGHHVTLGDYEIELPYCPNVMDGEVASGVTIMWEDKTPPLGYEFLESDLLVYQTLGDSNALRNTSDTFISGSPYGPQQVEQKNRIGSTNHNAHYSMNPFREADRVFSGYDYVYNVNSPFRYTAEARKGIRVRNIDFNDLGLWNPTLATPAYDRFPVLQYCVNKGFRAGTWADFGVAGVGKISDNDIVAMKEFRKSSDLITGLPANPGRKAGQLEGFVDGWHQQHKHKIYDQDDTIFPPYRSFRLCRRL